MRQFNTAPDGRDDDVSFDDELRLLSVTHEGPNIGYVTMASDKGDIIAVSGITYDHTQVGDMLNQDSDRGVLRADAVFYENISPQQQAIRRLIQEAREDPEIDLD